MVACWDTCDLRATLHTSVSSLAFLYIFKKGLFELVTLQPAQEQILLNSFLKVSVEEKKN